MLMSIRVFVKVVNISLHYTTSCCSYERDRTSRDERSYRDERSLRDDRSYYDESMMGQSNRRYGDRSRNYDDRYDRRDESR